jgi:hypothetical protein
MALRIGLDFDNTIACYDLAFQECARALGYAPDHVLTSKQSLKDYLYSQNGGEQKWQRIQGKVYGKFIELAYLFPGFAEFLWLCRENGAEVFIVSHKTEYGHFDEEKISLRESALSWMQRRDFFSIKHFALSRTNVFFESTREEKVARIRDLELDLFVDDLLEVLEEPNFPPKTRRILFQSQTQAVKPFRADLLELDSWRKISSATFPVLQTDRALSITQKVWSDLGLIDAVTVKGHGNSRVFRLMAPTRSYALKIYPDLMLDRRNRLENEFYACQVLREHGLPVPEAIRKDSNLNWAIYEWIEGPAIGNDQRYELIPRFVDFQNLLHQLRNKVSRKNFNMASESCLCGADIERQIHGRLLALQGIGDGALQDFLSQNLEPMLHKILTRAKADMKSAFDRPLGFENLTLSPSDFGFHNAKFSADEVLTFYDFEYFGWDDPVKLVSDSLWHPGMNLNEQESTTWLELSQVIYAQDAEFSKRLACYRPLFGIRWCLILLNEYLKIRMANRLHAEPGKLDQDHLQVVQLAKSKNLLNRIADIV